MSETKKCKHCQTEINKNAKVCPSCRKKQGVPIWLLAIITVVVIGAIGSAMGGGNTSVPDTKDVISTEPTTNNEKEDTDKAKPDNSEKEITEEKPKKEEAPEKEEALEKDSKESVISYAGGTYKIGVDMPEGEYVISVEDTLFPGYLELAKNSEGTLDSIITNDNYTNRVYITVKDGQYLKFDGTAIPVADVEPYEAKDGIYSDGTYLVGKDIPAGEYKVKFIDNIMGSGYFEVAKDSSGTLDSIITNDIIDSDTYQTVKDGQYLTLTSVEIITK